MISDQIFSSKVSGTAFISLFSQYLVFSPGSVFTNNGFKSKSSKFGEPLLTCLRRSVLPIISFRFLNPNEAKISLTSSATNLKKLTTFSGVPVNFFLNSSSC